MRKGNSKDTNKKRFWEDRAVIAGAMAVTVFLCFFTAFELFTIKMEWNVPVIRALVGGSDNYIFSQYREEEEALEQSVENVVEEMEGVGVSDNAGNVEVSGNAGVSDNVGNVEASGNAGVLGNAGNAENTGLSGSAGNAGVSGSVGEPGSAGASGNAGDAGASGNAGNSIVTTELEDNADLGNAPEKPESTEAVPDTEAEEEFPYYLKINRQQNVVTVYEKDENGDYIVPVKAILCSTGLYNATPKGTFQLSSKYIWRELNGGVYGQYASRITGGVLFHSVPYASKNKSTLYASKYNKLGQQASMGCVRLTVEDAKWIYDNCPSGTYVEVYDSEDPGPLGKPEAIKIDTDSPNKGWDPTDPDENNPWHAWSEDE